MTPGAALASDMNPGLNFVRSCRHSRDLTSPTVQFTDVFVVREPRMCSVLAPRMGKSKFAGPFINTLAYVAPPGLMGPHAAARPRTSPCTSSSQPCST